MLAISTHKIAQIILMGHELDRAEGELRGFIEALNDDEQAELVAIMWIGRGSFEADDFREALATAYSERTTPTADYLIGTPHMSDHLENGLDELGIEPSSAEDEVL